MKTKQEIETLKILGVNLDVYFTYSKEYGFQIDAVEALTDVQDIQDLLSDFVCKRITEELSELYRTRGWL